MVVFALLHSVFAVLFGVHLGQWDSETPSRYYYADDLASPNSITLVRTGYTWASFIRTCLRPYS